MFTIKEERPLNCSRTIDILIKVFPFSKGKDQNPKLKHSLLNQQKLPNLQYEPVGQECPNFISYIF